MENKNETLRFAVRFRVKKQAILEEITIDKKK